VNTPRLEWGGAACVENVSVAPLTSLRVGPIASRLITCVTTEQIVAALRTLDDSTTDPVLVLGGGSNVVIDDGLADLTVVRLATTRITFAGPLVRAEAGANWDDVVRATVDAGLGGLECLSGIPGSAGATPVQNVGAYGVEVAELLTRVRLLDRRTGQVRWVEPAELEFGYRHSVLKNSADSVVLEVEFELDQSGRSAPVRYGELASTLGVSAGERAASESVRAAVLALRAGKGMVLDEQDHDTWSVGSFFTNPVVSVDELERLRAEIAGPVPSYPAPKGVKLAAGWLVERAGFGKGYPGEKPGGMAANCRLSTKHALALTNRGAATSSDVLELARTVRNGVFDVFGITLQPEPVLVGCVL
jgi:UDP-N-acetylmuramate dehydrogenase